METPASCNWIPHPDPLAEEEFKLDITWTADAKTTAALERQARCYELPSVKDYLLQIIAAQLAEDEEDTVLTGDGRFVSGRYALDENLAPRNVSAS
jgi:hypothetical protein